MNKIIILVITLLITTNLQAQDNFKFYLEKALKNNIKLNAERKKLESAKQTKNISRSEFLPSITLSGDQKSSTSTNRTNKDGDTFATSIFRKGNIGKAGSGQETLNGISGKYIEMSGQCEYTVKFVRNEFLSGVTFNKCKVTK